MLLDNLFTSREFELENNNLGNVGIEANLNRDANVCDMAMQKEDNNKNTQGW